MHNWLRRFLLLINSALLVLIPAGLAIAEDAILTWDPNSEVDLAGYIVHYGIRSGFYDKHIDVGNRTTYPVPILKSGTYYFAITAYCTSGAESRFSNEVSKLVAASDNATYFAQVAVGKGFKTIFALCNTGAATSTGNLILTDQGGNSLEVSLIESTVASRSSSSGERINATGSFFPLSIASGATRVLTANPIKPSDATRVGWARIVGSGGSIGGAATFQIADGDILNSMAGVQASKLVEFATVPVDEDNSQGRYTGFAVANPGSEDINIKVVTVKEDGTVLDAVSPKDLNPLGPRMQVARFLQEYLPARSKFRGSLRLVASAGGRFIAVALLQNKGQYTTIPVISGNERSPY